MRFFFTVFILFALFAGCASVEPATEQEGDEAVSSDTDTSLPNWYDPLVTSNADSVSVNGFALASAADSSEAVFLAKNSAINNLRYEIDHLAESTRVMLVEDENLTAYSEASFIIALRNLIRDLPLSDANLDYEAIQSENEIYHVYSRASLPNNRLWDLVSGRLSDGNFIDAMKSTSEK